MNKPRMIPLPGSRLVAHVGDSLAFTLGHESIKKPGWRAFLRTNLGRGALARREVIAKAGCREGESLTFGGASWRDIPMRAEEGAWALDMVFTEVGFFRAKAYVVDPMGHQIWPDGSDLGISVLPDNLRSGNTIYCAFPRMFGPTRDSQAASDPSSEAAYRHMEADGLTVIPKSGTLRDLTSQLDHIICTLGCRVLHLLPIGPTPTVTAKMGRFGSPYAIQDLTAIDPALIDFDQRTTGVEQFCELADAVHLRGGQLFLDIVINHTGWHSRLMEAHPEWYHRNSDGSFKSPGAWGTVWGDLVELDQNMPELQEEAARSLLEWCRRGVDGFRCDAGYMVPLPAWQYVIARVRDRYPNTVFLLEGLGGAWDLTESLLTEGGMQWAYSELFQNCDPRQVSGYIDHTLRQGRRMGPLVHYSETHDNLRLAGKGRHWSLMRNRLCALASNSGAFGFACGVEWLASEKIDVHESRGLAWGSEINIIGELAALNRLVSDHPCFHDGAAVERVSGDDSWVLALSRHSADGLNRGLALINLDTSYWQSLEIPWSVWESLGGPCIDLLGQKPPHTEVHDGVVRIWLQPADCFFLSDSQDPAGDCGAGYRDARARAAWAVQAMAEHIPMESLGKFDWKELAALVDGDPLAFLAALPHVNGQPPNADGQPPNADGQRSDVDGQCSNLVARLRGAMDSAAYPQAILWTPADLGRVFLVPPGHPVLIGDSAPFEAAVDLPGRGHLNLRSIPAAGRYIASLPPVAGLTISEDASLELNRFSESGGKRCNGTLRYLSKMPTRHKPSPDAIALLTNGRGAMARMHVDLGRIASKYDCALAANLHGSAPCDRHVFIKRVRVWANADGFITPLNIETLERFRAGPPAMWVFLAHAGDGRTAEIYMTADLVQGSNTLILRFERPDSPPERGHDLPDHANVRLTVRLDLEDRSFHQETKKWPGADEYVNAITRPNERGFAFEPAHDRRLVVAADSGAFVAEPEWSLNLPHTVEGTRGMTDCGDAWSPGWFDIDLPKGRAVHMVATAEPDAPSDLPDFAAKRKSVTKRFKGLAETSFEAYLLRSMSAYMVARDSGSSIIAGYPWFLDWGRDTLIACRGLIACGLAPDAARILLTYAALEKNGTLPNMLSADSTANRDTSDAPLWLALASKEAARALGGYFMQSTLSDGRKLIDVLASIAEGYLAGTPNGIRVDQSSGLVWSPPHFTWMDTNYPAASPREGYPVEIQALWLALLDTLAENLPGEAAAKWRDLASLAGKSLDFFWLEAEGYFADVLVANSGRPAADAAPADHLRPNQLFLVALGLVKGKRAQSAVSKAWRHLLVPGGMRSLAPLPVNAPLPVHVPWGLLNDPLNPYWGRYEGTEDTSRKPAYHNGTVWVWPLGVFCEAVAKAWPSDQAARDAAIAILGSIDALLAEGCIGHLPEIMDGDAPHAPRGCDAQAWSLSEVIRAGRVIAEYEAGKQETG
jgi:predicted glycogen debranching enzyme